MPSAVSIPASVSGSRLRSRFYEGSDGSRHFIGFRDTELDIDCEFARLATGGYRCAPLSTPIEASNYFADDQCRIAAIGHEAGCALSTYHVSSRVAEVCDGHPHRDVHLVGQSYPSGYRDLGGSCEPYVSESGEPELAWRGVSAVDPEIFVEGTLEHVDVGADLSVLVMAGADGARRPRTLWFAEQPCAATQLKGAGLRCAPPQPMNLYTYFADDGCSTRLGYRASSPACSAPPYLALRQMVSDGECSQAVHDLVEVEVFTGTAYEGSSGSCTPITLPPFPFPRWVVGDAVDATTLPELVSQRTGTLRLRDTVVRTPNGSTAALDSSIFDTELDVACEARRFEDGVVRCTPTGGFLGDHFGDAQCTERVRIQGACDTTKFILEEVMDEACSSRYLARAVHRVGAPHVGPVYRLSEEDGCVEDSTSSFSFAKLDSVANAELVTLTEVVE